MGAKPKPDEAQAALVPMQDTGQVTDLLRLAVDKDIPAESLEKIVALHERIADRLAAQEFADALAAFQAECPSIIKNATAVVTGRSGGQFSYKFADLDHIAGIVRAPLREHGLSFTWDSQTDNGNL